MNEPTNPAFSRTSTPKLGYTLHAERTTDDPRLWTCRIFFQGENEAESACVGEYVSQSVDPCRAFEPFLRCGHPYALVVTKPKQTAVVDLKTGSIVAEKRSLTPLAFLVVNLGEGSLERPLRAIVFGAESDSATCFKLQELDLTNVDAGAIIRRFPWLEDFDLRDPDTDLTKIVEICRLNEASDTDDNDTEHTYRIVGRYAIDPPEPESRARSRQPIARQYFVKVTSMESRPGCWNTLRCQVFYREKLDGPAVQICEYTRGYSSLYDTFFPFIQKGRRYALISSNYTATSVLSLDDGRIVAEEPATSYGFCPTGFYVPNLGEQHPLNGTIGFVCGCVWGDDNSWKIEYLDLSRLEEGVVARENRFGYLELEGPSSEFAKAIQVYPRPNKNTPKESPWTGVGIEILGRRTYSLEDTELEEVRRENDRLRSELLKHLMQKKS